MRIQVIIISGNCKNREWRKWETLEVAGHNAAADHCFHIQKNDPAVHNAAYIEIK